MSTYLLIDDESNGRKILLALLKNIEPSCKVFEASSVDDGISLYLKVKPDLVFLDIEMPKKNGFEFCHELIHLGESPKIVFVTAFNQYAIEAIKISALDYLLKPVPVSELRICLNKMYSLKQDNFENQRLIQLMSRISRNSKLKIATKVGFELISPDEIMYCEADGNYTQVYLIDGSKRTSSSCLKVIEEELKNESFYRIGRATVINTDFLKEINRKEKLCQLVSGYLQVVLPLTQKRVKELAEILD